MASRQPVAVKLSTVLALALVSVASVCDDGPLPPPARSLVLLPPGPITIEVGETAETTASVTGVSDAVVTFASSDPDVATVTAAGPLSATVAGVAAGDATITAVLEGVELNATVGVMVVEPPPPPPPVVEVLIEGTLRITQDATTPLDAMIFDAGDGKPAGVRIVTQGEAVRIEGGDGFQPSGLPVLDGDIDGAGQLAVEGTGTIADIDQVVVLAEGSFSAGALVLEITVGANGTLEGGESVVYAFEGAAVP